MLTVFDGLTRSAIYEFTRTNGIIVSGTKPDSMMGSMANILLDISSVHLTLSHRLTIFTQ